MPYITVCRIEEIPEGEGRAFDVNGMTVGVFNCAGTLLAVSDVCSHAHALLHEGSVDRLRCTVECPLHGSEFDLRTGAVLGPPATESVRTFPVRTVADEIQVAVALGSQE